MLTHRRKKLELLIEGALLTRAEAILKEVGVQVFTVLDGRESRGIHAWSDDGVMDGLDHRYIVAVTTEACAAQAFERFAVPALPRGDFRVGRRSAAGGEVLGRMIGRTARNRVAPSACQRPRFWKAFA